MGMGMEKKARPPSSTRSRSKALQCVILGRNALKQHLRVSKPDMPQRAHALPNIPKCPPKHAL